MIKDKIANALIYFVFPDIHIRDTYYMKLKELRLAKLRFLKALSQTKFGKSIKWCVIKLNNILLKYNL